MIDWEEQVAALRPLKYISKRTVYYIIVTQWLVVALLYAILHTTPTTIVHENVPKSGSENLIFKPFKLRTSPEGNFPKHPDVFEQHFNNHYNFQNVTTGCATNCDNNRNTATSANQVEWKSLFVEDIYKSHHSEAASVDICGKNLRFYYGTFAKANNVTLTKVHDDKDQMHNAKIYKRPALVCPEDGEITLSNGTEVRQNDISPILAIRLPTSADAREDDSGTKTITTFAIGIVLDNLIYFYDKMQQMYTLFLMHRFFGKSPDETVMIAFNKEKDLSTNANIDHVLQVLFGPVVNMENLEQHVHFEDLAFFLRDTFRPFSEFSQKVRPLLPDFRSFVYNKYGLDGKHNLNCERLQILLVWRRDRSENYVERKIFNEAELYQAVMERYPSACVRGLLMDVLLMKEQLATIQHTDILIGMHGDELVHTLFLPNTSGLVELFPWKRNNFNNQNQYKFRALAKWRRLHYISWENKQPLLEMPHSFTVVNVDSVIKSIDTLAGMMCKTIVGKVGVTLT